MVMRNVWQWYKEWWPPVTVAVLGVIVIVMAIYAVSTMPQEKCIHGYLFTNSSPPIQVFTETGKGIQCDWEGVKSGK